MSTSKIKVQYGNVSFEAEGDSAWVIEQIEKFNIRIDSQKTPIQLTSLSQPHPEITSVSPISKATVGNLANFLISKSATTNQVRKFLATAEWLTQKGKSTLATADVTKALNDSKQSRLGNAAECLNRNIAKGFCEKTEGGFFVTPEGRSSVGTAEPLANPSPEEPNVPIEENPPTQ